MEMVDSMSQKNVEVYNENRWEMMKYNNTINSVKLTYTLAVLYFIPYLHAI